MKFNVAGKTFQQQLQAVSKVINSKNTLSILDNFLFRVEGNTLTITGSDQENVITASMEVNESECDGAIAINAKTLLDITKEVSGQPITFEINDQTHEIDLIFLNGHFNFMGVNADEYPAAERHAGDAIEFTVPAAVVQKGIEKTLFAVSAETIRPVMTGIFWDIHEEDITFVSSDTHKLVRYINRGCAPGVTASFIMPAKPANILKSVIGKEENDIKVTMDEKSATFRFGTYSLRTRFINGNYPNYNRVIPENNPFSLTVDRGSLLSALRRVSLFASKASSLVRLAIGGEEVKLSTQDLDYSTSADERVICSYDGTHMSIGFNAIFMIEILSNMGGDSVVIKLSDPARPGVFMPETQEEGEEIVVIQMPMQVFED